MVNTTGMLRAMAARLQQFRVKSELEAFDTGHLKLANDFVNDGLIDDAPVDPGVHGDWLRRAERFERADSDGAPPSSACCLSACSVGHMQLPYAALAPLIDANV